MTLRRHFFLSHLAQQQLKQGCLSFLHATLYLADPTASPPAVEEGAEETTEEGEVEDASGVPTHHPKQLNRQPA